MHKSQRYIPALGSDWLTPLYDPFQRWVMREDRFKRRLVEQAGIERGQRVLDLGCGTATLTILMKRMHPESDVFGLDGDARILEIARAKAAKAGVAISLDVGMAFQLPYRDHSFDRVLSSLMLHHLTTENKERTLSEVFRVLRPGGELHVIDFGKPHTILASIISIVVLRFEETSVNVKGLLPDMFRNTGFDDVEETTQYLTVVGALSLYRARKPR